MPKKTFTPEQIVGKLRQIEVLVSQGKTVPQACKEAGMAIGHVSPESFTHGSSAQRVWWFERGLANGEISQCNTFAER